jgi:hypothetical protein
MGHQCRVLHASSDGPTATCPAGAKAIAGGGFTSILIVGASLPTQDGTARNVIVLNPFSSPVDSVFGFAVCAAK